MKPKLLLFLHNPELALSHVGGLAVLERQLFTARRAGFEELWISGHPLDLGGLRLPEGLSIHWAKDGECRPPYATLASGHFVRIPVLRSIIESTPKGPCQWLRGDAVVLQWVPEGSDRAVAPKRIQLGPDDSFIASADADDKGPCRDWLLAVGIKPQDGFMARHFDRRISMAISKRLLETPVTPNHMTIASTLIGLTGASLFAIPGYWSSLSGALLIWFHSVIDGCDGELARVKFLESPGGADLDFWGDNLVHFALFSCLGLGLYLAEGSALPLALGAASALSGLGSAAVAYLERLARRRDPARASAQSKLAQLEETLAARDFIYLLVALAALGWTRPFLWMSGLGSPAFFAMTLYLRISKGVGHEQSQRTDSNPQGQAGRASAGHGSGHQHVHSGR
ncbi:MAG: CDP-alcohol phosphatidyltransferase family protein [Elusimicrobia bacterium]|nr:CDP-alcohol phosphatidyltransferase family protein [Elusimicrobiota bacterium]